MLAYGQPMHAFDYDKVCETKFKTEFDSKASGSNSVLNANIIVRLAKKGENILALDEETYELSENNLVIADDKKPIAIAGVMGGVDSLGDAA